MSRLPIRVRLTAAFAIAMAFVLAGSGWFLYDRLGAQLELALNRSLELRAQDLAQVAEKRDVSLGGAGRGRFVEEGERYAQVLDRSGHVIAATRALGRAPLLTQAELRSARDAPVFADRSAVPGLDEPSRFLAAPVGRRRILVVGATRQDRAETLSSFRDELLVAGPLALLLASLAGYALAGLSLRQVESMRARAAAISADTPGNRLPVPDTNDELKRLAETLNEMLDRLEAALERERAFVADAGHELRTPLTMLRTELELALRPGRTPEDLRQAIQSSSGEVDRLTQLTEDLLLIARTDRGELPLRTERLETDKLLESVVTRFRWRADEARRPLAADGGSVVVRGDRLRLEQALSNLVDNALRHGSGPVRLAATARDGVAELHVRDTGPGFPDQYLEVAFERFARPDAARSGAGTGLGLAIVRAIARAHGGDAHVANDACGGADVWLSVPLDM